MPTAGGPGIRSRAFGAGNAHPETMEWPGGFAANPGGERGGHSPQRRSGRGNKSPDSGDTCRNPTLRRLGVTKVQLGVQSLDDRVLTLNQRGHDVEAVRRAVGMLRAAGFNTHPLDAKSWARPRNPTGGFRPPLVRCCAAT